LSSSGITVNVKIYLQECNINASNLDKKLLCIIVAIRFWRVPRKEKDVQSVTTFENIITLSGYYFKPEQVRQIIDGYEGNFTKTNTRLSRNIRGFVEAIE